jgi:acid phosphatase family membrane protein YuiD
LYRVTAEVVNPTFTDLNDVIAVVVIFDTQGVARAAGETVVRILPRESSSDIVFTWPTAFDFTPARIEVVAYPSL